MVSRLPAFFQMPCLFSLALSFICIFAPAGAQAGDYTRRPLEHEDYDLWKTMTGAQISPNGEWVLYSVQSGAIDAESTLVIRNLKNQKEFVIDRGASAKITGDGRFAIFRVTPEKSKVKELQKKNTPAAELPKSQLQILALDTGQVTTIKDVQSFLLPEENSEWVACLLAKRNEESLSARPSSVQESLAVTANGLERPQTPQVLKSRKKLAEERGQIERSLPVAGSNAKPKKTKSLPDGDQKKLKKSKVEGSPLMLINLQTGIRQMFPSVSSFVFSRRGESFAFSTSVKTPKSVSKEEVDNENEVNSADGVCVINLSTMKKATIVNGTGHYQKLVFSEDGKYLAFTSDRDDYWSGDPSWSVYLWKAGGKLASRIVSEGQKGVPVGWWVSPESSQRFSEDGRRLYFDIAPVPRKVVNSRMKGAAHSQEDEAASGAKAKLDVWHWKDPQLQPQQLLQAARERRRDYRAVYLLQSKKTIQLATRDIPAVSVDYRSKANLAVANTNMKYRRMLSWDTPGFQDVWTVNLNTGKRQLCLEKVKWSASMSPEGRFITWFDAEQKKWFSKATGNAEAEPVEISKGIRHPLQNELHDTPNLPRAYGAAGWLVADEAFLVYDSYDIWQLDPTGDKEPVCLTQGFGRANQIRFRYRRLDPEERAIDLRKRQILEAFHRKTKASGFFILDANVGEGDEEKTESLRPLIMLDEKLGSLRKARDSDRVIFTRSTFRMCPDLWCSDLDFGKIQRVSRINPQQNDYTWGTAELVNWKASDGQVLDGILLKPDGFDPSEKYPLMVYFYERNSDNLHSYYTPAAGRSIICHSFYVSRGYVVFIPDIPYKAGEPGPSAANSVIPGVENLVDQGFIDRKRIGMQGHSWGGYQTAYLATQTDLFACAESGAPVSNMTSAYGGIRWGSGMSRMFQYERTQSRIGADLWSAREKYIANSPLFEADKINTPLLILHNDEDGAVPWYQGIELFVALRRLGKPAWMLNYNGNPHWVMGDYNRRDFAIRMQQFFDHYLKGAPEPEWMAVGVPAVEKGENFGLELLEPEEQADESTD